VRGGDIIQSITPPKPHQSRRPHHGKTTRSRIIIIILTLILAACGTTQRDKPTKYTEPDEQIESPEPKDAHRTPIYTIIETAEGIQRVFAPNSLELEHFLEGIDSLMYILENNFALLDVAYWAWEIDTWALADNARAAVLKAYEYGNLCEDRYLAILWTTFFPLFNTGHFSVFNPIRYHNMLNNITYGFYTTPSVEINNRLLETPLALRFYEQRVVDRLHERDEFRRVLREKVDEETEIYNRSLGSVYDNVMGNWQVRDANVITKTIEEGRIGYISIGSFAALNRNEIFEFFREIRNYEHLIIDLRGNTGGDFSYFVNILMRPSLERTVELSLFHFFMDGHYVRRHGDYKFMQTTSNGNLRIATEYVCASEILEKYDFTELQLADLIGCITVRPQAPVGFSHTTTILGARLLSPARYGC